MPGLGLGENIRVHLSGSLKPPNEAARCFPCNARVMGPSVPFEFELRLVSPGARISQSSTLETCNVLCSIIKLLSGAASIAVYLAAEIHEKPGERPVLTSYVYTHFYSQVWLFDNICNSGINYTVLCISDPNLIQLQTLILGH